MVWVAEQVAQPFISTAEAWELALGAKYLSIAVALQLALSLAKNNGLLFRSVLALFCIGAWVDTVGHAVWQIYAIDSTLPILIIWGAWFIPTVKKPYRFQSDYVRPGNVYIMLLRPRSTWAVCKALIGFPVASVCIYANGTAWSYRKHSGSFSVYPANYTWLHRHIAIDTGIKCSDDLAVMLDALVGTKRFPGTKCIWTIRHVLRKIGGKFAPRWCDYIPGIYAAKLLRGRE